MYPALKQLLYLGRSNGSHLIRMVGQVWITWSVLTPGVGSTPLMRYLEMSFPKEDIYHYEENREWTGFPKGNIYHYEENRE